MQGKHLESTLGEYFETEILEEILANESEYEFIGRMDDDEWAQWLRKEIQRRIDAIKDSDAVSIKELKYDLQCCNAYVYQAIAAYYLPTFARHGQRCVLQKHVPRIQQWLRYHAQRVPL